MPETKDRLDYVYVASRIHPDDAQNFPERYDFRVEYQGKGPHRGYLLNESSAYMINRSYKGIGSQFPRCYAGSPVHNAAVNAVVRLKDDERVLAGREVIAEDLVREAVPETIVVCHNGYRYSRDPHPDYPDRWLHLGGTNVYETTAAMLERTGGVVELDTRHADQNIDNNEENTHA